MHRLEKVIKKVAYSLNYISISVMALLSVWVVVNVFGRYLFNYPMPGFVEVMELLMGVIVFGSIAYTQLVKGNISIELIVRHFPRRVQGVLDVLMLSASLFIWVLITWQGGVWANLSRLEGRVTDYLRIPMFPFQFLVLIGGFVLCWCLFLAIRESFQLARERRRGEKQ